MPYFRISLYDMNGRLVLQQLSTTSDLISLDISSCAPGVYALEIVDRAKVVRKKLVVE